jgi:hypothetical protein
MQALSGTVGEGGRNARHDSALVQAILASTKRPANLDVRTPPYLTNIDGDCGDNTKKAIRQFQYDRVFLDSTGTTSQAVPGATPGLVTMGDVTWKAMLAAVPNDRADLRVLQTSKVVYVAAPQAQHTGNTGRVAQLTFAPTFRPLVIAVLDRIFQQYRISICVCPEGDRRDFQTQYDLLTAVDRNGRPRNVTRAGPGESNHNFGQAADFGFTGLRWLRKDGVIVEDETAWLHKLDPAQTALGEALIFWNMLRAEGRTVGMFRGPELDRPHLQAWSDVGIDMAERLAALLTQHGAMRWRGRGQRYQCDLGLRGDFYDVGSAAEIWTQQARLSLATLMQAKGAQAARAAPSRPALTPARGTTGQITAARPAVVTQADVRAMQAALRADFDAADTNWEDWSST